MQRMCPAEAHTTQDDVIDALQADGEHYAKVALTVRVGEKDALAQRYAAAAA